MRRHQPRPNETRVDFTLRRIAEVREQRREYDRQREQAIREMEARRQGHGQSPRGGDQIVIISTTDDDLLP